MSCLELPFREPASAVVLASRRHGLVFSPMRRIGQSRCFLGPGRPETYCTRDVDGMMSSSFDIMCAIAAFGIGIDIPRIRFFIHHGLS